MHRWEEIGKGRKETCEYSINIFWPDPMPPDPPTLELGENPGKYSITYQGGTFSLAEMLEEKWKEHLQICGCLWLRDLAMEEQKRGKRFTADDISAAAHARGMGTGL